MPRMAISELHHKDTKEQKNTELETQINALKEENAKLREELSNVWQLLGTIIKTRDGDGGKFSLSDFKKMDLLENIKEEEEDD
mmetsp:Transcript_5042/g.4972  ORF Transcript_5042/g.4972 Transcript_5042/m.4972 type:complete len:83 (+) Transcript_5042:772-1020(+)